MPFDLAEALVPPVAPQAADRLAAAANRISQRLLRRRSRERQQVLILDPLTGKPYRKAAVHGQPQGLIPSTILQQGFVPLKKQSDDSFCKTFTT